MTFDEVVGWLDAHVGQRVSLSVGSHPEAGGNSGMAATGQLGPAEHGWGLIDPRPGRVQGWTIGDASSVQLLEGDFERAELAFPEVLLITTREVQIIVGLETQDEGSRD